MTKEESLKLFRYFQKEFARLNKRFDATDNRIDRVLVIVDKMKGSLDDVLLELEATKH